MRDVGRVWLAALAAAICGTIAGVSIYRSTKGPPRRPPPVVAPDVRAFFDALTGIAPTSAETWPQTESTAREALAASLSRLDVRSLPPTAALAETFTGDLHAMLSGDFDEFVRRMRKQGLPLDGSDAQRAAWATTAKMVNWAALDPAAATVRLYALNGTKQPRPAGRPNFGTGTSSRKYHGSKLPANPDTGDLTILDVEFPMAISVREETSVKRPRVVQFRYAWNRELGVWSLWAIGTLLEPGDRSYGWPL